ncbi:MAG TPA: amidase, partial [Steroidobacteraceae bacterium]|nr:amidase [Steroidobacteraceae bacterium]
SHKLTAVQLMQFYLHRIRQLNPTLHAVITVSPTALADARRADVARRSGDDRPLLGIPILVKDNINTTGMPTTAGSWALAGSTPPDAFIVEQLKAAGAIIIGKANLSEWANFRSSVSSSGWSGIGGQTNMAYVLDRNPCGSSSGSAVAVSADLAVAAVGTETDGSIVCPSGANGVVGLKPTVGLLSRAGIIPISLEQDTAGPITRNVTDAAVLLGVMAGVDPKDPATYEQVGHAYRDYTQFLDGTALQGARIGVWRESTYEYGGESVDAGVSAVMEQTIAALKAAGATVVDHADMTYGEWAAAEFPALLCEFKTDIANYLQNYTGAGYPKTLQDLIDFNNAHPELESGAPVSNWDSAVFEWAQETNGRDAECAALRETATQGARAEIDNLMAARNLDAIVAPSNGPAWVTDPVNGDLGGDFSTFIGSSGPAAVAGYPNLSVPAGFVGPLPIGVSFIGGRWDEPKLISLGYAFEQATHARVPPQFIPTIGDDGAAAASSNGKSKQQKAKAPGANGKAHATRRMPPLG